MCRLGGTEGRPSAAPSQEAVAENCRAGRDQAVDEGANAGRGEVLQRRKPDAARMAVGREIDGVDEMQLADGAAALAAGDRGDLCARRNVAFVSLDKVVKERSI